MVDVLVDAAADVAADVDSTGRALRGMIDEQNLVAVLCQIRRQIDGRGSLADSPFLIADGDNFCCHVILLVNVSLLRLS